MRNGLGPRPGAEAPDRGRLCYLVTSHFIETCDHLPPARSQAAWVLRRSLGEPIDGEPGPVDGPGAEVPGALGALGDAPVPPGEPGLVEGPPVPPLGADVPLPGVPVPLGPVPLCPVPLEPVPLEPVPPAPVPPDPLLPEPEPPLPPACAAASAGARPMAMIKLARSNFFMCVPPSSWLRFEEIARRLPGRGSARSRGRGEYWQTLRLLKSWRTTGESYMP